MLIELNCTMCIFCCAPHPEKAIAETTANDKISKVFFIVL